MAINSQVPTTVLTPFRSGTVVAVTQGASPESALATSAAATTATGSSYPAYDFAVYGPGDYTVLSVGEGLGTVLSVGEEEDSGYTVRIGYDGYVDIYGNLLASSVLVGVGSEIQAGTAIGAAGSSGSAPFTKLHFERRLNNSDPSSAISIDFSDDPTGGTYSGESWTSSNTSNSTGHAHTPRTRGSIDLSADLRTNSLVFDAAYYLSKYEDLQTAFGSTNYAAAKTHWLQYGISEGRRASEDFDSYYYLQTNQDVASAYGANNYTGAITHYLTYGINEQRLANQEFIPIYYQDTNLDFANNYGGSGSQMLTSPVIFDAQYYLSLNNDVANFYGSTNYDGAKSHWLQYGITEGRIASRSFSSSYYLANNVDVANAYGAINYAGAISHWMTFGINEGRQGSADVDPYYYLAVHSDVEQAYGVQNFKGALTHYYQYGIANNWLGSDPNYESSTFNVGYYITKNPDVATLTSGSNQAVAALRHFYYIGIEEGKRASEEFDPKYYAAKYDFADYRDALEDYVASGKAGGRIGHNDNARTFTITDASIVEGDSGSKSLVFTVSLDDVFGGPISVDYATEDLSPGPFSAAAGSDYTQASGTLTFQPGEITKTISIQISGDQDCEANEKFMVTLSNPTEGAKLATNTVTGLVGAGLGTITNDDPPTVTVEFAGTDPSTVTESGTQDLIFTFKRTGPSLDELTVNYTVGGTAGLGGDYTGINSITGTQTITFLAGSSTATVALDPVDDDLFEQPETVIFTVANAANPGVDYIVGQSSTVTGTIQDDDLPKITLNASKISILEDNQTSKYTVSRDGDTSAPLTVFFDLNGTAIPGSDFNQTGATPVTNTSSSVTIAAGSTTADVTITPIKDSVKEIDKTILATIATNSNYKIVTKNSVDVTITDDDVESGVYYVMKPTDSTLKLTGTDRVKAIGNDYDNIIQGNSAINHLEGGKGADTIDGVGNLDMYIYRSLEDSQLGNANNGYDILINYKSNSTIQTPVSTLLNPSQDAVTSGYRLYKLDSIGNKNYLVSASDLTEASINQAFEGTAFAANSVAAITINENFSNPFKGTFLLINDDVAGFQADKDSLIFFKDYLVSTLNPIRVM